MKRISSISRPGALRFTAAAIVVGIAMAYTPALGDGSTWSLPYSGSLSTSSTLISLTNTGFGACLNATGYTSAISATCTNWIGTAISASGPGTGMAAWSTGTSNYGVFGGSTSSTNGSLGVFGYGGSASVYGENPNSGMIGVQGTATGNGAGVYGTSYIGVEGVCNAAGGGGVAGYTSVSTAAGLVGISTNGADGAYVQSDTGYAIMARSASGVGVYGYGDTGLYGMSSGAGANLAGSFAGNVLITGNLQVNGTINKSAVGFKIDHPMDPAHKFLMHSCVESNEMMNIYRGNATLDSDGKATVVMPDWFQAENADVSYQLTAIGMPAPGLYVSKKIEKNQFEVAGGASGMEVSWQVTGARNDKYAIAHPLKIELDKPAADQGKYIRPEEYGQPETKMIGYVKTPHHIARTPRSLPKLSVQAPLRVPLPASLPATPTTTRSTTTPH